MENQNNTGSQNLPQVDQNPTIQPVVTQKTNYLMIGGVALVCSLIFGVGGYYLGKQSSNSQYINNVNNEVQANPTATSPTSVQEVVTLPSDWEYKLSQQQNNANECVKFGLPPMREPYMYTLDENRTPSVSDDKGSGRFWYLGGGTYPNLLSKVNLSEEYKQTMAIFATEIEASGYVSQAVAVSCIPNNGRFANNTALISSLTTELEKYNSQTGEKGMQASTYKINSNSPATKWGKNVANLVVSEDAENVNYTMFVTPQYVYEIKVFGATTDTFVKDTAKKIFDNLSFQ